MKRRNFVIGLGALSTGTAAAVGTGAFTSVEADRDVSVEVADDAAAFLSLTPGDENGDYAEETDGTLELQFTDEADVDGAGFNQEARTDIDDVAQIENQGTQEVEIELDADDLPDGVAAEPEDGPEVRVYETETERTTMQFTTDDTIGVGDEAEVDVIYDHVGSGVLDDADFTLVISAEATD